MKRLILSCILLLPLGCGSLNEQFVKSVDDTWKAVEPEYSAYVATDINLQPEQKQMRQALVKSMNELLAAAKENVNGRK